MSEEEGARVLLPPRPTESDPEAWKTYWEARGQPWRTEPETNEVRQQELAKRYTTVVPDIQKGVYPFRGMQLSRADIEWLLATYQDSFTPEKGLDVRGANLNGEDLSELPLRGLRGGLTFEEWVDASEEQRKMATVHMNNIRLNKAQLQGAHLNEVQLQGAHLNEVQLQGADLSRAQLQGAHLSRARLQSALLYEAQLQGARLYEAQLQRAYLSEARLHGAHFSGAALAGSQGIGPELVDVQWDGFNLAIVDWSQVRILGNEYTARQKKDQQGSIKDKKRRLHEYQGAVRANRQLAVALQAQGLNEDAARFAYRAQQLQRIIMHQQHKFGQYLFSWFLDLIAGYGYRPGRSVCWYLMVILGFALAYHVFGGLSLFPPDAFIYSLTSFHGRGFFPGLEHTTSLHDPLVMLAALEAVVGLLIEISFIATFTQRFFGK